MNKPTAPSEGRLSALSFQRIPGWAIAAPPGERAGEEISPEQKADLFVPLLRSRTLAHQPRFLRLRRGNFGSYIYCEC